MTERTNRIVEIRLEAPSMASGSIELPYIKGKHAALYMDEARNIAMQGEITWEWKYDGVEDSTIEVAAIRDHGNHVPVLTETMLIEAYDAYVAGDQGTKTWPMTVAKFKKSSWLRAWLTREAIDEPTKS